MAFAQRGNAQEPAPENTAAATESASPNSTPPQDTDEAADQASPVAPQPRDFNAWRPLAAMCLGITVVLGLMIGLKVHAFFALILGALVISCWIPLDVVGFVKSPVPDVVRNASQAAPIQIVNRVTNSLGGAVSGIGILIAMAAIIGKCMLVSGAADRIVKSALAIFGEKRAALAMMVSGFILSIPVFFDTVFYLLVPLARSLYRRTGKNYLLYLGAIAAGGAVTHTLVPPTPGPLLVAEALEVSIGTVMLIGLCVGIPSAAIGLLAAAWLNKKMPIEMRPMAGSGAAAEEKEFTVLPSLPMAIIPVLLPVLLISIETIFSTMVGKNPTNENIQTIQSWLKLIGSPNLAMILAAIFAIFLCWKVQKHSLKALADHVEDALLSGGVIILITAAGGAFGGLLAMTEIQLVVKSLFEGNESGGLIVLVVAFGLSAALKIAQGSSTVAMIISSSLVSSIALPLAASDNLGFHPAYLVSVIGSGSLMGSWMNDSGFWVFSKMGVLTEGETLRSWTVLLSILSISGFLLTTLMATIFPLV
ncbi:GntP family permease [Aureliella helgolandensis]|nr:GntP family permease [Aureliella helgolandensis]